MLDSDIYFWRQSLVFFTDFLHALSVGVILSFPSVLDPAILSPNATDIRATKDQALWINSLYGFSGVISFCVMPSIMQNYGRKITITGMNLVVLIGFVMIAVAKDVTTLYVARIIQGLSICGVYLSSIILSEYSHPKRRGYFISLQKGLVALGSLMCHALILVCTWRQIASIATIVSILSIILTYFWPESPAFLAMKGRYEECDKSYIYLNGDTPESRKELEDMKSAQDDRRRRQEREATKAKKLSSTLSSYLRADFLKPFFIATLLTVIIYSCGRYFNIVYIIRIITEITADKSIAIYCSISLDFIAVVSCCASSFVITKLSRRSMLFIFGYFSVFLIFLISLLIYSNLSTIWLTLFIILINNIIINIGIVPICFTVSGEIFPLEHRGSCSTASGIVFTLLYAITMKFTAVMIEKTGIHGTYAISGICMAICLLLLHFILPETKDKTLQQIEDEIKDFKRDEACCLREREILRSA